MIRGHVGLMVREQNLWSWGCGFELKSGEHVAPLDKVFYINCSTWPKCEWGAVGECHNADRLSTCLAYSCTLRIR